MDKVVKFQAIGTHWWIEFFDDINESEFQGLSKKILDCVSKFENDYSRFKDTSIISKLNHLGELKDPPEELLQMIELGETTKKITNGHFNIAVGKVLEDIGYDKNYSFESKFESKIDQQVNQDQTYTPIDTSAVVFSKERIKLSKNIHIDLGGIGKGFLIDKIKNLIKAEGIKYFFINAGGDIYATSDHTNEIEFYLENPFDLDEMIGKIKIMNQSIASSSPTRRRWKDKKTQKVQHHLIDMVTKKTADDAAGVYTLGKTATDCDLASTALFVSPKELYGQIAKHFNIEYLVVFQNKSYLKSENYTAQLFS